MESVLLALAIVALQDPADEPQARGNGPVTVHRIDLNHDGRLDRLTVEPDGSFTVALNRGAGPRSGGGIQEAQAIPFFCARSVEDQTTGACILVDSTPTLGRLYPLGPELSIDPAGNVGIGTTTPTAALQVASGAIRPTVGNSAGAGISFPPNPFGGAGDEAFIRYYSESAEDMKLLIGIENDSVDDIGFQTDGLERMTITSTGVGIGTTTPSQALHVNGVACADAHVSCSDRRLKEDVRPLTGALDSLLRLQAVRFSWNDVYRERYGEGPGEPGEPRQPREIGLIAQQVEEVFPELVSTSTDGYRSVDYGKVTVVLLQAIQEQQATIDELKREVAALQER